MKTPNEPSGPADEVKKTADLFTEGKQVEVAEREVRSPQLMGDVFVAETSGSVPGRTESTASEADGPISDLPPSEPMSQPREQADAKAQSWLMVTNQSNLLYMLAAGMAMGPAGFAGKHYRDPSSELVGLIPAFRDNVPEQALKQSISERKNLRACIAELDLTGLAGQIHLITREGEVSTGELPSRIGPEIGALLLPAYLPVTLVTRVLFRSAADRKAFEASARSFANTDLSDLKIEVAEQAFRTTQPMYWPLKEQSAGVVQGVVDRPPARGEAVGGCLAMLYHLANRSDLCGSIYRMVTAEGGRDFNERDTVLAGLLPWIESGIIPTDSAVQSQLFWGAVQALVDARLHGSSDKAVDIVVSYLDGQLESLKDATVRSHLERLISDMRGTFGLGGGTISQLFDRHKGALARPLLLFCLRERCMDLLEFSHPDLGDEELALAAVLFGVREGWIGLPTELRKAQGLERFIGHRMFMAECTDRHEEFSLAPAPPRPIPLRELLRVGEGDRSQVRNASLAKLASKLGWDDCVVSSIRLPTGRYRLNVTADGIEVVVRGAIRPPTVEIDKDALLKRITQWPPLPSSIENEVRAELESKG